jgi:iron complex outermembrane receptor protein
MFQRNKNRGEETIIPEYKLFDAGIFVYTQKHFGKTSLLSGGIRGDARRLETSFLEEEGQIKFEAVNKSYSNFSASIGFSTSLNKDIIVKANLARGYRAPNMAELFSNGAHEGTNRFEYGNRNLKAENSLQGDAGLVYGSEHLGININAFYNRVSNFIFYQKLEAAGGGDSIVNAGGEDIPAFAFNQANATLQGADFTFDFHPHPMDWLHISTSFSAVTGKLGRDIDGTRNLPLMPAPRNRTEIRGQWPKSGENLRNFYVKLEADFVSQQNRFFNAYETETFTDAYTLTSLGLGTDLFFDGRTIASLHFAINNLGDVKYQDHLSRLKYTAMNNVTVRQGVFGMGRNFTLKLFVPLNFKFKPYNSKGI